MVRAALLPAVLVLGAGLVTGCGSPEPAPPPELPCPVTPQAVEVTGPGQRDTVVSRDAADYRGPGPHPVLVVRVGGRKVAGGLSFGLAKEGDIRDFPKAWSPPSIAVASPGVRLVACRYLVERGTTRIDETCRYTGGYLQQFRTARWAFRVWEAKTGRFVGGFDLVGKRADCPPSVREQPSKDLEPGTARPEDREVIDGLRPFVEKTVP
ncbi:hypothetical protein [Amycolatopsis sp. EV170708-02-1]|uniref:hypothetical protein n=1 Tax=Amycolatopsis sp. EV170708-02-1 TaxID=2919322 RepID=UPI001F0C1F77|nr:hypothetical protein [Amycolatopsis sp. EV170708-02-1]UMP05589.1 hypothetical protein MJQ72_12485 [Amycolatopsis sp. EV170708-02-1]